MATQLFVDNMAEQQNAVDGESACGDANSWKDRKCNVALITGITGQVNTLTDIGCHDHYCSVSAVFGPGTWSQSILKRYSMIALGV